MADNPPALHGLARVRFGELSTAEVSMLDAAISGTMADCRRAENEEIDPGSAERWGDQRVIRADVLRWMLVDRAAREHIDPRGVHVAFARIEGRLDLSFMDVDFPLRLCWCALPDAVFTREARLRFLSLTGSRVRQIMGNGLHVDGDVHLDKGFQAEGTVRLTGASIMGYLECGRAQYQTLVLTDATIGNNFACRGSTFNHPKGDALMGDRLQVGGGVYLDEGFQAKGTVRLLGASITRDLICSGGIFEHSGRNALSGDGLQVGGGVYLNQRFQAKGTVQLTGASITGDLDCRGGVFNHPKGDALSGDGLQVGGAVYLDQGSQAKGEVRLHGASITGDLSCNGTFCRPFTSECHDRRQR